MTPEDIQQLFSPCGFVSVRRMFGGKGVFVGDMMIGLEAGGVLYLKTDPQTAPEFAAAGSEPFSYEARTKVVSLPYWRLPEEAFEDEDCLKRWFGLAEAAARRAAQARHSKGRKRGRATDQ